RFSRDWSSDVCSSDLIGALGQPVNDLAFAFVAPLRADHHNIRHLRLVPFFRHARAAVALRTGRAAIGHSPGAETLISPCSIKYKARYDKDYAHFRSGERLFLARAPALYAFDAVGAVLGRKYHCWKIRDRRTRSIRAFRYALDRGLRHHPALCLVRTAFAVGRNPPRPRLA